MREFKWIVIPTRLPFNPPPMIALHLRSLVWALIEQVIPPCAQMNPFR